MHVLLPAWRAGSLSSTSREAVGHLRPQARHLSAHGPAGAWKPPSDALPGSVRREILLDCVLREPSPSTDSPGGGEDPLGKDFKRWGASSFLGSHRRNCLHFFPVGRPLEASVAQNGGSEAKWKDDFGGRLFYVHTPSAVTAGSGWTPGRPLPLRNLNAS